jgi:hypothetical protein
MNMSERDIEKNMSMINGYVQKGSSNLQKDFMNRETARPQVV